MADPDLLSGLLKSLAEAGRPLMIRECARGMGVSLPTAGKYVDVAQAAGLVEISTYATAKQVRITAKGRKRVEG